jgi:hypothetical protein
MTKDSLKRVQQHAPTDEAMASAGQEAMRAFVKSLPDDTLSLSWRSSLNEKLVQEAAARRRRTRLAWYLRPALGLGLACTLAVLVMFRSPHHAAPTPSDSPLASTAAGGLEAALVTTHRQSGYAWDVAGVGLSPTDPQSDSDVDPDRAAANGSEDDLDSL